MKKMSLVDKHALYLEHLNNPTTSYSNLAIWAAHEFNLATTPSISTIGNTLKHHATQCDRADSKDRTNNRRSSLPDVEEALVAWVLRCEELGVCLTGELIRKQALAFCATMEVPADQRHSFSKGWLYKFQRKHGLTSKLQHGEAGSTPPETVEAGRAEMQTITTGYEPADIYNMDETLLSSSDVYSDLSRLVGVDVLVIVAKHLARWPRSLVLLCFHGGMLFVVHDAVQHWNVLDMERRRRRRRHQQGHVPRHQININAPAKVLHGGRRLARPCRSFHLHHIFPKCTEIFAPTAMKRHLLWLHDTAVDSAVSVV
ncbi:hypothetical protein H257_14853 [Aphanomyces astaci]|uniref:HTH CENPB-type domain-containing protein n=1 Tax=Aphanomyces astaci TaxID=112090 RepID=W4FS65_APHAT|nr:hypothetical protein H257_14853 [Aphanomyces astaci]ETV69483.1 hypothetical protein H257_14853 [Aphanomyces astaci]|eukprot:XP_009841056.1 hypothetical protein H257_14853 [Aphanomyces astaci]